MTSVAAGRLLVAGDVNPDLVMAVGTVQFDEREQVTDRWELTVGGSASIFACAAARLGIDTELIGSVGADSGGEFMLSALREAGVQCGRCRSEPGGRTALTVVLAGAGQRAIVTGAAAIRPLLAAEVVPALRDDVSHLHVAGLFIVPGLAEGLVELLGAARARGASTSLDTNWDPSGEWRLPSGLGEVLDCLLVNEAEARALAETGELLTAATTVVIKRGAAGATAVVGTGDPVDVAGFPVSVVDTTGAGDNFDAGFVAGRMLGLELDESLRLGCACGALSTEALGGAGARVSLRDGLGLAGLLESVPGS